MLVEARIDGPVYIVLLNFGRIDILATVVQVPFTYLGI